MDDPGEDATRVFLIPADFPAGELDLTATITGTNGQSRSETITVTNVPTPPSTAMVGPDGAVLGTVEENGGTSTLSIPPGVAGGATVTFESRTQENVKASTGVDYDALGVTFLGAQEISSSEPLDGPVGLSSGGFGPQVQPGQAIVNFAIRPDGDGDGIDELTVINSATVAPNGDVISDPVPVPQVGAVELSSLRGTSLVTQQSGIVGPLGTIVRIEVSGLNASSLYGNRARFRSLVDDSEIEMPGRVSSDPAGGAGQLFTTVIPPLPEGPAEATLRSASTGYESEALSVVVTSPAIPSAPSIDVVSDYFDLLLGKVREIADLLGSDDATAAYTAALTSARSELRILAQDPANRELFDLLALMIHKSGLLDGSPDGALRTEQCRCCVPKAKRDELEGAIIVHYLSEVVRQLGRDSGSGPVVLEIIGRLWALRVATDELLRQFEILEREVPECPDSSPPVCAVPGTAGGGQTASALRGARPSPRQVAPAPLFTGMGSGSAGGEVCGSVAAGVSDSNLASLDTANLLDLAPGRFVIKYFASGSITPFTDVTDAGGYFYIPLVPGGQPYEAVAIDTETGESRTLEGIAPPLGEAEVLLFDFLGDGGGSPNASRVLFADDVDLGATPSASRFSSLISELNRNGYLVEVSADPLAPLIQTGSYDTIVLSFRLNEHTVEELDALDDFVADGGRLILIDETFGDEAPLREYIDQVAAAFGLTFGDQMVEDDSSNAQGVAAWPVTMVVAANFSEGVESLAFFRTSTVAGGEAVVTAEGTATVATQGGSVGPSQIVPGAPVLISQVQHGAGSVIAIADGSFFRFDSDFAPPLTGQGFYWYDNCQLALNLFGGGTCSEPPLELAAQLLGANVVPAPTPTPEGSGAVTATFTGETASFVGLYLGISGLATGGDVHGPATATETAPVVLSFTAEQGSIEGEVSTDLTREDLRTGLYYVDIRSTDYPDGALRGQLHPGIVGE